MKRRKFTKLAGITAAGLSFSSHTITNYYQSNANIRLGGPIFKKVDSPDEWINSLKQLNYKAAYCPLNPGASREEITAYKKAAQQSDIVISEIGAWSNPIDPDPQKSNQAIEKCIRSLQLADDIGANCCVNISGSRNPENWAGPHKDNLTPDTFDLIVETSRKIIDAVKPTQTYFTLETMPWSYPDSVESYEKLLKAIDRERFAVHFDPVNLVVSPQVYFKNGDLIKSAFKKLGRFIKSCHAKDILLLEEKLTPHLPEVRAGLGNLNYPVFLRELSKLDGIPLMMEHLKTAEEYNLAARHIRNVADENQIQL